MFLFTCTQFIARNTCCAKPLFCCKIIFAGDVPFSAKKSDRLAQHGFWANLRHILPPFNAFKYIMPVRSYSSTFILNRICLFFWHNLKKGKVKTLEKESIILSKPETFCIVHYTITQKHIWTTTAEQVAWYHFSSPATHRMVEKVKRDRNYLWLAPQTCTLHRNCQHCT